MAKEDTQFKPGNPGGGRPKGSPNKTTKEIRDALQAVYSQNLERLQEDLDMMPPFQRQMILDKVVAKVLPNLLKSEETHDGEIKINVTYKTKDQEPGPVEESKQEKDLPF